MGDTTRLIFWLLIGIIWIISAFTKRRSMEKGPVGKRELDTGDVYKAPEDDLKRFLKMISGESEETTPPAGPPPQPVIEEKEDFEFQPEFETPPEIEPEILPTEEVEEVIEEPLKIERKLHIPSVSQMTLSELQRAIVLAEILGPPRTTKPYDGHPVH
jgi:hypothetical protein